MSHPVTKEEIVQELDRIPDDKLEELFQVVQSFGVEPTVKETPELEAFAGSWKDWSEPEFLGFLEEVTHRRSQAFSKRDRG